MRLTVVFAAVILVSFQAASGQTPLSLVGTIDLSNALLDAGQTNPGQYTTRSGDYSIAFQVTARF